MIKPRKVIEENKTKAKDKTVLVFNTDDDFVFFSLLDNRIDSFLVCQEGKPSYRDIYLARVNKYIPGIRGYFLAISSKEEVFLQEDEIGDIKLLNREYDGSLKGGDILPIQIKKEAYKNKSPYGTTLFELTGDISVVSFAKCQGQVSISKKINDNRRVLIKANLLEKFALENIDISKYNITVRTGAFLYEENDIDSLISDLYSDILKKIKNLENLFESCKSKVLYNKIFSDNSRAKDFLKDCAKIVADNKRAYDYVKSITPECNIDLYEDSKVDLISLYGLKAKYNNITQEKVNLKNDGYIYINPTEALTVIDVNSGSAKNNKDKNKYILDVNLEAANEIAYQIRVRNLSGILIVDFINMKSEKDITILTKSVAVALQSLKPAANLVDITKLGLFELTRVKQTGDIYSYKSILDKTILR